VDSHHGKSNSKMKWHSPRLCPYKGYERIIVVVSIVGGNGLSTFEINNNILWQLKLHKDNEEFMFYMHTPNTLKRLVILFMTRLKKGELV